MDDILYILIGVVWLILGIYKNSQKNKSKMAKQPKPIKQTIPHTSKEPKNSTIKEIFGDFFQEEEVETNEKPFNYEDIDEMADATYSQYKVKNYNLENENDINTYKKEVDERKVSTDRIENDDNFEVNHELEEFDARKAIVYSAIIQRPYD